MSKRPAKTPTMYYMPTLTSQPVSVRDYVEYHLEFNGVLRAFARLLVILVSRKLLNAAELYYVVSGTWVDTIQFADWDPDQEIAEGKQPSILRR